MAEVPKEILDEIRRIEILSGHLAEDLLAGAYHSVFKGQGMEFEEVREYVQGDDIRTIDWNVTARFNHPYVKIFREERELPLYLAVDISPSSMGGSGAKIKRQTAAIITALLSFAALKNNDKSGLVLFSENVEKYVPPRKGFRHALRIIRDALITEPKGSATDLKKCIEFLINIQKRTSIIFIISDFLAEPRGKELRALASRSDVIGINVVDPWEVELPKIGLTEIIDPETKKTMIVDLSDESYQSWYSQEGAKNREEWKKTFIRAGGHFITVRTDEQPADALRKFFKFRKSRV